MTKLRSRAAILYEFNKPLVIDEITVDAPKAGEVRVKMAAAGVCHSDLHVMQNIHPLPLPLVIGHEGAGVVESVGPGVTHVQPGDHVVLSWLPSCGVCRSCQRNRPAICLDTGWAEGGKLRDGTGRFRHHDAEILHYGASSTFSDYTVVPAQSAIKVDRRAPLAPLSLIGCAVTTGVGAVLNSARVRPEDRVAIVGCGGVGLSAVQGARIAGAEMILAVDTSDEKLALARELGATHTVNSRDPKAVEAIHDLSAGGVDFAFEAVGLPVTIDLALAALGKGGEAILIGMPHPDVMTAVPSLDFVVSERGVRGSWYGSSRPTVDFPKMVEYYLSGALRLDLMVETRPLEEVNDAFDAMAAGKPGRTVLTF